MTTHSAQTVSRLKRILIVDSDTNSRDRYALLFKRKGYDVYACSTLLCAEDVAFEKRPAYALMDLKLHDGYGLEFIPQLRAFCPAVRIIIQSSFASLATAVAAIKLGAIDLVAKPADIEDLERSFMQVSLSLPEPPERPMSPNRVKWEHIQRVYNQCDRNVSMTARTLGMHRRTLQRILAKNAPR